MAKDVEERGEPAVSTGDTARDFAYVEAPRHSPTWQLLRDVGETIVLTLLMFLVIRLVVQDYQVDGTSMVPTLQNGQYVLVDKLTYTLSSPHRGDIIVFNPPTPSKDPFIKRIIGLPGDTVDVADDGVITVDGTALDEHYVNDLGNIYGPSHITVGPNQYFVLGDNRGASQDSRYFGTVNRSAIIGKASLVYWPLNDFHLLSGEQQTYTHIVAMLQIPEQIQSSPPL